MADDDDFSVTASMADTASIADTASFAETTSMAETGGSANWQKYVGVFLPLERATELSAVEQAVEKDVVKIVSAETWYALPKDIRINIIRGNAHEKERLKVTAESAKKIADWRVKYKSDTEALKVGPFPGSEAYFSAWTTRVAGVDAYGHPILYDRFSTMNVAKLLALDEDPLHLYRAQALEALSFLKQEISSKAGIRVSKHVYVLDLAGLEPSKHFTLAAQKKLKPVMKMSADMFPETLWAVWVINAPLSFRFVWNVVRTWLDPLIRAKIRMFGSTRSKWYAAMEECGITLASLPAEFGGTAHSQSLDELLMKAAVKHSKEAANAVEKAKLATGN